MKPSDHLSYFAEHPVIKNKKQTKKMTTGELFLAIEEWGNERNIISPENRSRQALKVMEEVGETMAALARGNHTELKDGIGDSIVTLIILAAQSGFSAHDCLHSAYNEIKDRKGKTVDGVFIKE
jgi:phosphoribosyl-ATP pyrophosphohydrolase